MSAQRELLLEIGCEEIPAAEVMMAAESLRDSLVSGLDELRLSHGPARVYATPRRLAVVIPDVATRQSDETKEVAGPPVKVAFKDGQPTKAAEGFAKGLGLEVGQLTRRETDKGEYLFAVVEEKGQDALALLPELILQAMGRIPFKRTMRWGDETQGFIRPIQWILSLFGGELIELSYADVRSARTSRGHRFMGPEPFEVTDAAQYLEELARRHVIADVADRRARIVEGASRLASSVGGHLRSDEDLIDEITQLVENPVPMVTHFERSYLDIPDQVLISEMREHQRYLSVVDAAGKLMPHFVVIGNTKVADEARVLGGYRRVLSARFADGAFFYTEDQKAKLSSRVDQLSKVQFHRALGSIYEKVERIARLSFWLAGHLGVQLGLEGLDRVPKDNLRSLADQPAPSEDGGEAWKWKLARAAFLAKADLTTRMVFEFPELQGVMGRAYAEIDGEPEDVAAAIEEHYMPKNAQDELPAGTLGALVGLADRLDTIAGIMSVGKGPTGAADPFGLRRAALAVINLLRARGWKMSLEDAIHEAVGLVGAKRKGKSAEDVQTEVSEFFRGRLRGLLTSSDAVASDVAEAVLSAGYDDVVELSARARALAAVRKGPDFDAIANAVKRVDNILKKAEGEGELDPSKLEDVNEKQLFEALGSAEKWISSHVEQREYESAFKTIAELGPALARFFGGGEYGKGVLVMHEDPTIRSNRISLVRRVQHLFAPLADFTKLS